MIDQTNHFNAPSCVVNMASEYARGVVSKHVVR